MRRLTLAAALAAVACASIGTPPGGPQRDVPPTLGKVAPDSGAVGVTADHVTFDFDIVVSDRPVGVPSLEETFIISPRDGGGPPRVNWKRSRIEVRPRRGGFRPNTAYSVTMLPGIADLQGHAMKQGRTIVFSTGPTIPPFTVRGRVFDWLEERVAPRAVVEVIRRPDSLPYIGAPDSTGQFAIGPLAEGTYTARAFLDVNNNHALDPTESWDSVTVTVRGSSPFIELLAAPRDTNPPRLLTATPRDSVTLLLSFDRPLDPALPVTPENFRVRAADSSSLRVVRARARRRGEPEPGDTSRARADSARADSVRADSISRPKVDSTRLLMTPRPSLPAPPRDVIVQLDAATPMRDRASYRVTVSGVRGLLGASRPSDRVVTFERARPDSSAAPPARRP